MQWSMNFLFVRPSEKREEKKRKKIDRISNALNSLLMMRIIYFPNRIYAIHMHCLLCIEILWQIHAHTNQRALRTMETFANGSTHAIYEQPSDWRIKDGLWRFREFWTITWINDQNKKKLVSRTIKTVNKESSPNCIQANNKIITKALCTIRRC